MRPKDQRSTNAQSLVRREGQDAARPEVWVRRIGAIVLLVSLILAGVAPAQMRVYQTRHYTLHTDVDETLARDIAARLDAMFEEYARRFSGFAEARAAPRFDVHVFSRRIDYARLTENRFPNTAGIFMSGRNLLAAFVEGQGREAVRQTLQHEAFHQFAHWAISPNLPVWLNEGLAQLFEEAIWTGDGFLVGQVPPRRLRQLRSDIDAGRLVPFERMLSMTDRQWADAFADANRSGTQYNQAWAMAHFLVYAADEQGQPRFRGLLLTMLRALHAGKPADEAWRESFGENNAGFERRFLEWAAMLEPTPQAQAVEHQQVLGDLLVLLADDNKTFDSIEQFAAHLRRTRPRLTYTRGLVRWTSDPDATSYLRDPAGRPLPPSRLRFVDRPGAPLPDLYREPTPGLRLQTRFVRNPDGTLEHETALRVR